MREYSNTQVLLFMVRFRTNVFKIAWIKYNSFSFHHLRVYTLHFTLHTLSYLSPVITEQKRITLFIVIHNISVHEADFVINKSTFHTKLTFKT